MYSGTLQEIINTHIIFTFLDDAYPGGEGFVRGLDLQNPFLEVQSVLLYEVDVVDANHLEDEKSF